MRGTNGSSSSTKTKIDGYFSRNSSLRRSTGQMKDKQRDDSVKSTSSQLPPLNIKDAAATKSMHHQSSSSIDDGVQYPTSPSVHSLIKGFQNIIGNGDPKPTKAVTTPISPIGITSSSVTAKSSKVVATVSGGTTIQNDPNYKTPGYVVEPSLPERTKRARSTKRKLSIRSKKSKNAITDDSTRYNIIQSLGMSPYETSENRSVEKSFSFFDIQSLFFDIKNAASIKSLYEEDNAYAKKLSGASAASQRNLSRKRLKTGEVDPVTNKVLSRAESLVDEGDEKENHLVKRCPYFRNEIAEPEDTSDSNSQKYGKDISKLISMFNRNRSFENLSTNSARNSKRHHKSQTTEEDIFLEGVSVDSEFFSWDEPNVNEKQIFDFEHIDRGAMYYHHFFDNKEHYNLFGIDEKYGPMAISIVRELIPKMAVLGHNNDVNEQKNKKYQYRIIFRTCELYTLRICVMESSIPSLSQRRNRPLPLKDIIEYCFPEVQLLCLRHCTTGPKVPELLRKLDQQQLSTTYKIGLLYCKPQQSTEEAMYNNEHGGSEFQAFCSIIADTVTLKGFQGYRAQLDNKNDSTGEQSLYTIFHGREIMFHVSTKLPYTAHDRQQLLRKRHIGNDIVTVVFQDAKCEPFTPAMMRSHFQHVFIVVRVENPHTENTKYEVAVSRSRDVPYFGPPIPPTKFDGVPAFREFLLSKLINAENAAHKSEKFTHMARRTRYEYLKDLSTNHVSQQTLEVPSKFGFSFSTKKKEKTHPVVNPEMWLQGGLVWTVKFDFEHDGPGSSAFLSISTKAIVFVEQSTQKILVKVPCKNVLGWRTTAHTLKLFYNNGKMAFFTLVEEDVNELPFVVNRLKAVTPGCETMDLTLRRNTDGQLGFHVYYEGLVAEVEPYGLAWQAGLRRGSRLLEISGHIVGNMNHERMILMLKRPGVVRIVVLPPESDGQPRNYKAARNLRRYSSMTSVYSMSAPNLTEADYSSSGLSSSKEYINSQKESPQVSKTSVIAQRPRSLSVEKMTRKPSSNSSDDSKNHSNKSSSGEKSSPNDLTSSGECPPNLLTVTNSKSQERIIQSRSATELPSVHKKESLSPLPNQKGAPDPPTPTVAAPMSPGVEAELGEIERALTDTRKSIDAKFFRSLANSSPFFPHSKTTHGLTSPEEENDKSDEIERPASSMELGTTSSDIERESNCVDMKVRSAKYIDIATSPPKPPPKTYQSITKRSNSLNGDLTMQPMFADLDNRDLKSPPIPPKPSDRIRQTSPNKFCTSDIVMTAIPFSSTADEGGIYTVNTSKIIAPIPDPIKNNLYVSTAVDDGGSNSDSSMYSFTSEKDSVRGSLVRTKVRDATDIINERNQYKDSINGLKHSVKKCQSNPSAISHDENQKLVNRSSASDLVPARGGGSPCRMNILERASINTVQHAAKQKTGEQDMLSSKSTPLNDLSRTKNGTPVECRKYDESLNETFANLDAAFGYRRQNGNSLPRPTTSNTLPRNTAITNSLPRVMTSKEDASEEKVKRKKATRRRRNFEPPHSDSSDEVEADLTKRRSRNIRRSSNLEDTSSYKAAKSEAEESLEAALSDFRISLSDIHDSDKNTTSYTTMDNNNTTHNTMYTQCTTPATPKHLSQKLTHVKTIPVNTVQVSSTKQSTGDTLQSGHNCTPSISDTETPQKQRNRSEAKISLGRPRNCASPTAKCETKLIRTISAPEPQVTHIEEVEDITIIESVMMENEIIPS